MDSNCYGSRCLWEPPQRCPLRWFGLRILILPHVVDRAGAFAPVSYTHLQTNKINAVLGSAELIHSVGSLHLAQAISSRAVRKIEAGELAGPQRVLIEVNVSGEESKGGFSPDEIRAAAGELAELEGICVQGLMTMAPRGNKDVARRTFAGLRELRDELEAAHPDLNLPELSCGMSEDFESALEEGSTLVRLGRVVFSPEFAVK